MDNKYILSVVLTTYNSKLEKILSTIDSIITQKDILLQLVVADDGSTENHFDEIEKYLNSKNFNDYALIGFQENQGTIKNLLNGVNRCEGKWIKPIAPGDIISGNLIFKEWIELLESDDKKWSFCDAVYYVNDTVEIAIKSRRHPSILRPYTQKEWDKCRYNYVVRGDSVNGATVICDKTYMFKYLTTISSMIKYAEDYMYILMMWDGYVPYYFECDAIRYEYGGGISTSKNKKWIKILIDERNTINNYVVNSASEKDKIQKRMKNKLKSIGRFKYFQMIACFLWRECVVRFEKKPYTNVDVNRSNE